MKVLRIYAGVRLKHAVVKQIKGQHLICCASSFCDKTALLRPILLDSVNASHILNCVLCIAGASSLTRRAKGRSSVSSNNSESSSPRPKWTL